MKEISENQIKLHCGVFAKRTSIGLEIDASALSKSNFTRDNQPVYSDDFFEIGNKELDLLISCNQKRYKDESLKKGTRSSDLLFIPLGNPRTIRLIKGNRIRPCFNFGELFRIQVLRYLPNFPLKPHQIVGAEWLQSRKSAILADDMGLGKTLQAIAALSNLLSKGMIQSAIVICPKSLIGVWESEFELWAPHLCKVSVLSPIDRSKWDTVSKQTHVAITNYETVRKERPDAKCFDLVILDEIHKLKNPRSQNYKSLIDLIPNRVWGLSGTPLENTTSELVSILHIIDQKHVSLSHAKLGSVSVRKLASKYTLRRNKSILEEELPEVVEKVEHLPLTNEQKSTYEKILLESSISRLDEWITTFNLLRQTCDYDPDTLASSKIDRVVEVINAILGVQEKVVVFSYLVHPLEIIFGRLKNELKGSSRCNLVRLLTGTSTTDERKATIQSFQTEEIPKVLLCTTRALAEGVTLTRANHVVFLNEWWNPSVNKQARDRIYRIGQKKDVFVYKFRSAGTIESRLEEILEKKSSLFRDIILKLSGKSTYEDVQTPLEYCRLLEQPIQTSHVVESEV